MCGWRLALTELGARIEYLYEAATPTYSSAEPDIDPIQHLLKPLRRELTDSFGKKRSINRDDLGRVPPIANSS